MSVRLIGEEVLRWAVRTCNQRLPWQHRAPQMLRMSPLLAKEKFDTGLSHIRSTGKRQGPLAGHPVNIVRYYCQGKTHDQEKRHTALLHDPAIQPIQRLPEQPARVALFYKQLKECGSPMDVLDLVSQYKPTVKKDTNSLMHIWSITKKMSEEQRRYELRLMFEHDGFKDLLQRIMLEAGHIKSQNLAYSLLATVKLGVPPGSRVVQTFLRVSQERLNEFDEKSLSVLASCLESMETGTNVDALKKGLKLIITSRLESIQNVIPLQTLMRHVGKDASLNLKKKLERKVLSMTDQFSLPNCQYMISTLAAMNFPSKPLLDVCSKKIAENVHCIPFNRLLNMLMSYKELHYRDMGLFITISEHIASTIDMWNNRQVILILSVFEDLGFRPTYLMDVFLERVTQNPGVLTVKDVLSILKTYSSLNHDLQDHRQQFLDSMTHILQSYLPKMSASELLRAVSFMCVLGHFPSILLEQLLQSQTLERLSAIADKFPRRLQVVDRCLRLEQPHLPHIMAGPPVDPKDQSVNPKLSKILHSIMGDTEALQEGVLVENSYFLDVVITNSTEGTALSERTSEPPEPSERIAVICAPPAFFCYGSSHPRGNVAVQLRHLKILGYTPVLVAEHELETLPEEEMAEVLRAQIFQNTGDGTRG